MKLHSLSFLLFSTALGLSAFAETPFTLSPSAALESLDKASPRPETGGFSGRDVKASAPLDFSKGTLSKGGTIYEASSSDVDLRAEFVAKDGYVLVNGTLKNKAAGDRAIILDYRVGFEGKGAVFSNSLNKTDETAISDAEAEGNAFPVAALGNDKSAIAVAIPPLDEVSFGVVGSPQGLSVRFYLGLTPLTKAFPNEAHFSFLVYPSRPGWGFRDALAKYYDFFPERYKPKPKQAGYYMFIVKGLTPKNVDQYAFNTLEIQSPDAAKDIERDDKHGISSLLYTLVGQREIKFLDKLPENYDEALGVFKNWSVESHRKFPVTKESVVAGSDAKLREEVESSAVKDADGKYVVLLRNTPWGKNSVSFKVNPSPYLFADMDVDTVGRNSIRLLDGWLKEHPQLDGVLVDSLGANWPAVANYRQDHFEYAQHPLTFDSQGRLFLHNEASHFEWVQSVHDKLEKEGRYLFANGVYAYRAAAPEHYLIKDKTTRPKLGRFFISSLLDGATCEAGTRATTERAQDVRIMLGRKYYAFINYDWEDQAKVEQFFNRSLAYGIFASNTLNYGKGGEYVEGKYEGIPYADNPNGSLRDKALLDWFLPKAVLLHKAGWQPVTFAEVSGGRDVYLERFGSGNDIYFTVFNDSDQKTDATIKFDLAALGIDGTKFEEITRDAKVDAASADQARLALEPHKTYILHLSKTGLVGKAD